MAIQTKYVIQDATNLMYYTEDHSVDVGNRWTNNFNNAHLFDTISSAENEIDIEEYNNTFFQILPITQKL